MLSRDPGVNPKRVATWRERQTVEDSETGPKAPCSIDDEVEQRHSTFKDAALKRLLCDCQGSVADAYCGNPRSACLRAQTKDRRRADSLRTHLHDLDIRAWQRHGNPAPSDAGPKPSGLCYNSQGLGKDHEMIDRQPLSDP